MEDSHIHDLPDCALEFCRAAGDTIPSFAQQKRQALGRGGGFLEKRRSFVVGGARSEVDRAPPRAAQGFFACPGKPPTPLWGKKRARCGTGPSFLGKRDQFLMWMARFWTFSAHSRTDSETVG